MNAAVDLAAEILCQPSRADRSKAMPHHENLRKTVLVPEPGDDTSHIVSVLLRRPIAVKATGRSSVQYTPLIRGAVDDHQRDALFFKNALIHSHERLQVTLLVSHGLNPCNARVTPEIQERRVGRLGRLGQDRPLELRVRKRNAE